MHLFRALRRMCIYVMTDVTITIHAFQVEGVAQLDIQVGMCEQDAHIQEVVLRAVQKLGFADPRPQQMVAIKTLASCKENMPFSSVCQLNTANR